MNTTVISRLQQTVEALQARNPILVKDLILEPTFSQHRQQGLYEISDPSERIVYIGKTTCGKDGIAQRIYDHAHNISGLRDTLGVTFDKFGEYTVKVLPVPDCRERGLAEYYAIAVNDPRGNLVG